MGLQRVFWQEKRSQLLVILSAGRRPESKDDGVSRHRFFFDAQP
jgi:hypothetical protein